MTKEDLQKIVTTLSSEENLTNHRIYLTVKDVNFTIHLMPSKNENGVLVFVPLNRVGFCPLTGNAKEYYSLDDVSNALADPERITELKVD